MSKIKWFLPVILLFVSVCGYAQTEPNYDTILPKDDFIDTVKHVEFTHLDSTGGVTAEKKDAVKEAEANRRIMKGHIQKLTARNMYGRGYVKGGRDSAAIYIARKFMEYKLQSVTKDGRFGQGFSFPVNTFPGKMKLQVNDDSLTAGLDFIIDPGSPSYTATEREVKKIDLDDIHDRETWKRTLAAMDTNYIYYFTHVDSFCANVLVTKKSLFADKLPAGCYIIAEERKLIWGVSRENIRATVFYVRESVLPKKIKKATIDVKAVLEPRMRSENVLGYVPGDIKDTFIAFTAHYDHLGMMGDTAMFPGASDNASGVAMLLHLAAYYAKHPQRYSMLFIAFAGEEAALMGSEFFTRSPLVPLKSIKFLTNIDIMGDASDGITVVNATEFPRQFDLLKQLNAKGYYLPQIKSRGPAANSDHYYFTKAGVPSFFIYSNGGKGYYHDVFDKAREISLIRVNDVGKLLIDFVRELK